METEEEASIQLSYSLCGTGNVRTNPSPDSRSQLDI
jgi:hypothetical protein